MEVNATSRRNCSPFGIFAGTDLLLLQTVVLLSRDLDLLPAGNRPHPARLKRFDQGMFQFGQLIVAPRRNGRERGAFANDRFGRIVRVARPSGNGVMQPFQRQVHRREVAFDICAVECAESKAFRLAKFAQKGSLGRSSYSAKNPSGICS